MRSFTSVSVDSMMTRRRNPGRRRAQLPQEVDAVAIRQHDVEDDDAELFVRHGVVRLGESGGKGTV